jgi:hypothetical protein
MTAVEKNQKSVETLTAVERDELTEALIVARERDQVTGIGRRIAEIDSGQVEGIPTSQVFMEARAVLNGGS